MRCPKIIPSTLAIALAAGILTAAPAANAATFYGTTQAATTADTAAPTLVSVKRTTPATITPTGDIVYSWTVDDIGVGADSAAFDVTDAKGDSSGSVTKIISNTKTSTGYRTVGETTITPNRTNMKPGKYVVNSIVLADKAGNQTTITNSSILNGLSVTLNNPDFDDAMPVITGNWSKKTYAPGERAIFTWTLKDANVHQSVTYAPLYRLANGVYLRNVLTSTTATEQVGYSYYDIPQDADYKSTLVIEDAKVYDKFNIFLNTTDYKFATATIDDTAHPVAAVVLTGKPGPGQKVSVNTSAWKNATIKVEWNAGVNSQQKTVTGSSFTFPTVAKGYGSNTMFTVKVTGTWADGTVRTRHLTSFSEVYSTPAVQPGKVGITGTAQVGNKLTGTMSGWPAGYKLTGQWKFPDNSPAAPVGETTINLTSEHARKTLQFCVTGVKAGATTTGTCTTKPIENGVLSQQAAAVHWDKGFKTRAVVGDTATLTFAVPKAPGSAVRYEWFVNNVLIPGATSKTYKIPASAAGKVVRGRAVVTAPGYNALYASAPGSTVLTATVGDATVVSGTRKVGSTLTAKAGSWTKSTKLAYLWLRNGQPIWGQTKATYTQVAADLNTNITVRVTATRPGAETVVRTSDVKGKTQAGALPAATFKVTGTTKKIGNVLKANQSSVKVARQTLKYQWYRNGKAIKGAVWSTYRTTKADTRTDIQVRVTMTAPGYTGKRVNPSNTVKVAPGTLKVVKAKIKGTTKVGKTLTVDRNGSTAGTRYSYQWYKNGKAIKGATGRNYKVGANEFGATLQARVVLSKAGYNGRTVYTPKVKVAGKTQKNTVVTLKGTAKVGKTLSVSYSKPEKGAKYTVQWYRNGKAIKGATKASYKLVKTDRGKTVKATVKSVKSGFSTATRSVSKKIK